MKGKVSVPSSISKHDSYLSPIIFKKSNQVVLEPGFELKTEDEFFTSNT